MRTALTSAPSTRSLLPDDQGKEIRPVELVAFELMTEDVQRGPAGTVPLVRRDLDRITTKRWRICSPSTAARAAAARRPRPGCGPARGRHGPQVRLLRSMGHVLRDRGQHQRLGPVRGVVRRVLARAVRAGPGQRRQADIEAGHQEYRDLYGDWVPHLFVFYTTNGYTSSGDNKGGYNQDVDGWVQYSSRIYPEALSTPVSAFGGTQYVMNLKWQLWQGNWWLRVQRRLDRLLPCEPVQHHGPPERGRKDRLVR